MNKWLKVASIVTIALTIGVVTLFSVVSAQEPTEEDGFFGRSGRGGRGFGPQAEFFQNEDFKALHQEALAEALGLSVAELEAAKAEGQSLRELAEAQGIDLTDVQAALAAARQEAIDQAVTDGLLTQEEANQLSERFERSGPGNGHGPHFGPRGNRGAPRGFGVPSNQQ